MMKHLDRNLYIGGEVKEVYDELVKTLDEDHLRFDLDDYVLKAPLKLNFEASTISSLVKKGVRKTCINAELIEQSRNEPPWGAANFRDWNKT
jgi:23S rRNA A2030 N6-methylase RlmJ